MTEPTATSATLDPSAMTSEQAAAAIATGRDNPALYDPTHPEHAAATSRMNALDARQRGGAAPAPLAPSTESPSPTAPAASPSAEEIAARLAALPDHPHAEPRTAAELEARPPREFSPEAVKAGFGWDKAARSEQFLVAEREGFADLVGEVELLIASLAGQPMPTAEETEDLLELELGSRYALAMAQAGEAWTTLLTPRVRQDLTRTGMKNHHKVVGVLIRLGARMWDATTPQGEARLKKKYSETRGH